MVKETRVCVIIPDKSYLDRLYGTFDELTADEEDYILSTRVEEKGNDVYAEIAYEISRGNYRFVIVTPGNYYRISDQKFDKVIIDKNLEMDQGLVSVIERGLAPLIEKVYLEGYFLPRGRK